MGVNRSSGPLRAARFLVHGSARIGRVEDRTIIDAGVAGPAGFLPTAEAWARLETADGERRRLDEVALVPPLVPAEIVCVGLNYRTHAEESGFAIPVAPILFSKLRSTLAGPRQPIELPPGSSAIDWEAELAVVIGRPLPRGTTNIGSSITAYTGCNDVSDRDAQVADGQWMRAKSFDTFFPIGPTLVRADDSTNWSDIKIACRLNGETMQLDTTANLIFGVEAIVAYITQFISLAPGTVICTGTPAGIGHSRQPPVHLRDGDMVEVEVGSAGPLTSPVHLATPVY